MKKYLLESIAGFIFWASTLTPYMLWVVKCNKKQYIKWLIMEVAICFALISPSLWFIKLVLKIFQ